MPEVQVDASRAELLRKVLDDCLRRRSSGEALPDAVVISSHPELMPELEQELRQAATVELSVGQQTLTSAGIGSAERSESGAAVMPESFPGYEIIREIHRGGQGVVYQALQKSTRRRVALKVLHGGALADERARARIEREVQILGQITHPNVVAVHDSGSVAGCLYCAMDYIAGQPLDAYLTQRRLSSEDALRLFARICEAVNAAHLRGVIHRDLKPANILVDSNGEPHVVDFGLARLAVDVGGDSDAYRMTMTGQFLGSAPWASPEQAEGIVGRIDIRTDVYSLGVILYQILTNRFPYEVTGKITDVLRRIVHEEPARPSTVRRRISGDLDTIVLKCLDKSPERRYQSAGELARDIRHYLAGEPIEARRDSALYVLRKLLARYRLPAAVGTAFLVLIVAFAVTMTLLWQQVRREGQRTAWVADFLDRVLLTVDPEQAEASLQTPLYAAQLETVENAARKVPDLSSDPQVEARIRNTLGRLFINLGRYEEARQQLQTAADLRLTTYGQHAAQTAESQHYLAWALKELGRFDEADRLYQQALQVRRALFGSGGPVAETLNNVGQLYYAQQKYDQAEACLRDALALRQRGRDNEKDMATGLANLGSVLRDTGRLDEAESLLRDALEIRRRVLGEQHFHTIVSMNKLGLLLRDRGRASEACELLERTLELRRQVLPKEHPHIAVSLANLGMALADEGNYAAAVGYLEDALTRFKVDPRANLYRIHRTLTELVEALRGLGESAAAEQRIADTLAAMPRDDPQARELRARARLLLAELHLAGSAAESTERELRGLASELEADLGAAHEVSAQARSLLGACLARLARYDEAEPLLIQGHEQLQTALGPRADETLAAVRRLIEFYTACGQPDEAERYRQLLPAGE